MAIDQGDIPGSASYSTVRKSASEGRAQNKRTAFLCHSHLDAELAKGLQGYLHRSDWEVYIDWEDATMPERPDRRTAETIQAKIRDLEMFFFLATQNSMASRWCPWEIGFADGVKSLNRILVIPTRDSRGVTHGNEYLELYRHLDKARTGGIGSYDSAGRGMPLYGNQSL